MERAAHPGPEESLGDASARPRHRARRAQLEAAIAEARTATGYVGAAHSALAEITATLEELLVRTRDAQTPAAEIADLVDQIRRVALLAAYQGMPLLDGTLTDLRVEVGPAGQPVHVDIDDVACPLALLSERPSAQTVQIVHAALRGRTVRAFETLGRLTDAVIVLGMIGAETDRRFAAPADGA